MNQIEKALLASKIKINSTINMPLCQEIEVYFNPQKQNLESFFSDAIHCAVILGGSQAFAKKENMDTTKAELRVQKRVALNESNELFEWLSNFAKDDVFVGYASADNLAIHIELDKTRTFLSSFLENDLKYRLQIHEYYLDKVKTRINFVFDNDSMYLTRGRETMLRMKKLPIRFIRRLVNNKNEI